MLSQGSAHLRITNPAAHDSDHVPAARTDAGILQCCMHAPVDGQSVTAIAAAALKLRPHRRENVDVEQEKPRLLDAFPDHVMC